ncbi:hypothetical protein PpBr36_01777 [Pyricularia pennisetigena]|uniref:hypothetical protein n=1 Tax=Pyricularia pennisetigena TaxID=1578925 RepID=UPI0011542F35|nr:hypothetical protein PpBr36_01777 [Pyricularia pennisetigena]TLS28756.1 hypothetical protein PpBr36_01777 [Pyricularia pennisetigena]
MDVPLLGVRKQGGLLRLLEMRRRSYLRRRFYQAGKAAATTNDLVSRAAKAKKSWSVLATNENEEPMLANAPP